MGNSCGCMDEKELNLAENHLQAFPVDALKSHITSLDLSKNAIVEIPSKIGKLSSLKFLFLKSNQIQRIPDEICILTHLTVLNLDNNLIGSLPDSIGSLSSLEILNISHNNLTHIPSSIGLLSKLATLNVSHNRLRDFPDELHKCEQLSNFIFEHNTLNLTFQRFVIHESLLVSHLRSFLLYRSKNPLLARYTPRHDHPTRDYYADHALQQTSWVDPRYYDYVRTLPYEIRVEFNLEGDSTTHALPLHVPPNAAMSADSSVDPLISLNNWGCPPFSTAIFCSNARCSSRNVGGGGIEAGHTATMECPYRLCERCCTHTSCGYHTQEREKVRAKVREESKRKGENEREMEKIILSFDERRARLYQALARLHPPEPENYREKPKLQMFVRRASIMEDSFHIVMTTKAADLRLRLWVRFDNEEGIDYGGLTREWFLVLMPAITNPNYALFTPSPSNVYVHQINPHSAINPDHLQYFRFTGRILGMALFDTRFVDTFFSPIFYKQLLGIPLSLRDLEYYDDEFYRSLLYLQENEGVEHLELNFTTTEEEFGVVKEIALVENGASIAVTDSNKAEYIRLMVNRKLCTNTAEQMASIKRGFHDVIPESLLPSIGFTAPELEMLICGVSVIDSADWQRNTEYGGNYGRNSPMIVWFWDIVQTMTNEDRARLLQFVTGTTKLPHGGFAELMGSTGPRRFQIIKTARSKDFLPTAHTCFNQLELPEYESKDVLRDKLSKAVEYAQNAFVIE